MKPLLAVDIGNSSLKVGLFADLADKVGMALPQPERIWEARTAELPAAELGAWLPPEPVSWQVVSVQRQAEQRLLEWIGRERPADDYRLLSRVDLPLEVCVKVPDRVGVDRLAAAVAANKLREPKRPAIVVDAGSAITVDLVAPDGSFQGGAIYPGFRLSAEALSVGTDQLPLTLLAPLDAPPEPLGKETGEAIRSGLFWGGVGAVKELVARLIDTAIGDFGDHPPHIFITGGDLRQLALHVPESRFVPNMVLAGIALAVREE